MATVTSYIAGIYYESFNFAISNAALAKIKTSNNFAGVKNF